MRYILFLFILFFLSCGYPPQFNDTYKTTSYTVGDWISKSDNAFYSNKQMNLIPNTTPSWAMYKRFVNNPGWIEGVILTVDRVGDRGLFTGCWVGIGNNRSSTWDWFYFYPEMVSKIIIGDDIAKYIVGNGGQSYITITVLTYDHNVYLNKIITETK